eukprot:763254-Hanusia_phi.AAC.2
MQFGSTRAIGDCSVTCTQHQGKQVSVSVRPTGVLSSSRKVPWIQQTNSGTTQSAIGSKENGAASIFAVRLQKINQNQDTLCLKARRGVWRGSP